MGYSQPNSRQYWLWITRPEFYLGKDGNDSPDLDPTEGLDTDGWWTCHKHTRKGDLAFLWRTSPRNDIGYLAQAESDAYAISDEELSTEQGWNFGCDYQVLYKFPRPITLTDIRNAGSFEDWGAYRRNFQGRALDVSAQHWRKLNEMAAVRNPGYQDLITQWESAPLLEQSVRKQQLEDTLMNDLAIFKKLGYGLELYRDSKTGNNGRQFVCMGNGGRIDLLCIERALKRYVVIELKNTMASLKTFSQISNNVTWAKNHIARGKPVIGLVISRGCDARFAAAIKASNGDILQIELSDLGIE